MPRRKVTTEIKGQMVQMYRKSPNYKQVGRQLGLDWRTVKTVIEGVDKEEDQSHWLAVTREVDAQLLQNHYKLVLLGADWVETAVSMDPIEAAPSQQASTLLNSAAERGLLQAARPPSIVEPLSRDNSPMGGPKVSRYSARLLRSLLEHEPQLDRLLNLWSKAWDLFSGGAAGLSKHAASLQPDAAPIISMVLHEALECRILGLDPKEFRVEAECDNYQTIRRGRQNQWLEVVYSGEKPKGVREAYEGALAILLQQTEWDQLEGVYLDTKRWSTEIIKHLDTLALRGRPRGKCSLCPSAG